MSFGVAESLVNAGMREEEAQRKAQLFAAAEERLDHSRHPEILRWFVPGRIEVLGKHTDYAGGRSLLCTAERGICVSAIPRMDAMLHITDVVRRASFECMISPDLAIPESGWKVYPSVVARRLARNFAGPLRGAQIAFASDLPPAAGMSSSSALVVALFAVLSKVNRLSERSEYTSNIQSLLDLAAYLGCIENGQTYRALPGDSGVGTFGGSEDHTAILTSEPAYFKQYSFCPVRHERTAQLPPDCVFVIGVSGVVADKTGSARARYNQASLRVQEILHSWRTMTGLDTGTLAEAASSSEDAPDRIRAAIRQAGVPSADCNALVNRFDQFWLESERIIPAACEALAGGTLATFGALVDKSQQAAETLLGNQVPETIRLAKSARELGAYAASAFGAGFGGSVWALVSGDGANEFARQWQEQYQSTFPARASQFFVTAAGPALLRL